MKHEQQVYFVSKLLLFLIITTIARAQWTKVWVGSAPNVLSQLRVGDGRNDGIHRVYAVCEDGHVYEWTFSGNDYTRVDMGEAPGSGWCLGIDMGDGRNDGQNRVYMTRINGHVYEYYYTSNTWVITDLGNPNATLYGVKVGNGHSDGVNRVYASGDGVPPVEYTWTGSIWHKDTVEASNLRQWLPEIGAGRNDGVDRLYLPNSMGSIRTVSEYTWTGSSFSRADLPVCPGNPLSVEIGSCRNDGVNRVYASTRQRCHEFTYQSGNWSAVDILPALGDEARYDICLGSTKSDGLVRAYITCSGTQFVEASWNGSTWIDTTVDAVSAATCGVHIGRGRNDDTVRVYGCNRDGDVFEFTHSDPYVGAAQYRPLSPLTSATICNLPNPFSEQVRFEYTLPHAQYVKLAIYDITGREITSLVDEHMESGKHLIVWRGTDAFGRRLPSGVYICRLRTNQESIVVNVLLLN